MNKTLSIRLDEETHAWVEEQARREERTPNQMAAVLLARLRRSERISEAAAV